MEQLVNDNAFKLAASPQDFAIEVNHPARDLRGCQMWAK